MRTGGDDIAQALALIGARPRWEPGTGRVTGFEIMPLAELGRPRVDVTLRISGFFRDAFPDADRALRQRDPRRRRARRSRGRQSDRRRACATEAAALRDPGSRREPARRRPPHLRLEARRLWRRPAGPDRRGPGPTAADLADAYVAWGAYAYGAQRRRRGREASFVARLSRISTPSSTTRTTASTTFSTATTTTSSKAACRRRSRRCRGKRRRSITTTIPAPSGR